MNIIRTLLFTLLFAWLPAMTLANCSDLNKVTGVPPEPEEIGLIQRGLRTALSDNNPLLSDGRLGDYTRDQLVEFCRLFPLPGKPGDVDATLALAAAYGQLAADVPDWKDIASADAFADRLLPSDDSALNTRILALIGPASTTTESLENQTGAADCAGQIDAALGPSAQAGQLVLNGLDPDIWPDAAATCTQLDLAGGAAASAEILSNIGMIEAGLPGSINQLLAPDFALWLGEDIALRGPRLLGNPPAVVALVAEYRGENRAAAPRDFSTIYQNLPDSCAHGAGSRATDYISFDQRAFDSLVAPVDVNSLLGDLAGQSFDSNAALISAIETALVGQVNECTMDQVLLALNSPENFGQAYMLNAEKAANLALQDDFAQNAAIVEPFVGLSSPSRASLLAAIRGALQNATAAEIDAEVEAAADVLASAAEPVSDTFDTRPEGVPEFDPLTINPTIGVTLNTDSAVEATVADAEFRNALLDADYQAAPNAEVLKSDARKILDPIAAEKIATAVNRAMVQLQPAVDTSWGLTDTLSAAIAAAPAAQGVPDAAQTAEITQRLTELIGVEYPTARLFDAAIAPFASGIIANDIRASAAQSAPALGPNDGLDTNIALPDCGCTNRREDNTLVYGFMPFWMAPPRVSADSADSEIAEDAAAADGAPAGRLIDFGIVNRAAFYGLEFDLTDGGNLYLRNEEQWTLGMRDFVRAAHRHRAKADLAITLSGWQDWSDLQISDAAQQITDAIAPFARADSADFTALAAAFPTILDPARADGVTLIVNDYDGTADPAENIQVLNSLVSRLQGTLSARGQSINLAFDLDLGATDGRDKMFQDISELLVGADPKVDLILLFLERPTTDSKKILRARMESGVFGGSDRAEILRRIVPVLPPAAHQLVHTGQATATPAAADFSQFVDDLVYFQDNFAGVGFWPAPDPFSNEAESINAIFQDLWLLQTMPSLLSSFEDEADRACTFICPNRSYFAAGMLAIFLLTALLVWRSFYSGFMDKLAFKFGFVWIGTGIIFAGLIALSICDTGAFVAPVLLVLMLFASVLLLLFYIYQRAKNGPKP
ncbi:hypothetical protein [Yoonia sp. BS5-3]|uniref:Peptidoglycan binding-like domain-containing protein n=1 Tax=Yoonia phaeophyticola TaxID=3137369 RepID=A0ABZ2V1H8_9RHOB